MKSTCPNRCEICGAADWEVVLENHGPSVCSGRELVQNDTPLVKSLCRGCGFVITSQSPLDTQLDDYYRASYSSKLKTQAYDYINFSKGKRFGEAVNDFVLSHDFSERGRMLDIGCGKGLFERAFRAAYPRWEVEGVDPSERSIEIARQVAPHADFHCRKFTGADFPARSYDLIAMHTVINRAAPRTFVGDAAGLLKEGGALSVAVAILPEAPFELYFADHHYMYFRAHVLALAEEFGFQLVSRDEVGSIWRYLFRKTDAKLCHWRGALAGQAGRICDEARRMAQDWRDLFATLERLRDEGKSLAFYGAGTTLMILLAQTDFPRSQIIGLFDDNPCKHGEQIWGRTIQPRSCALQDADAVVLCAGPGGVDVMRRTLDLPRERLVHFGMPASARLAALGA